MRLVDKPIALKDLSLMAEAGFGNLVKAVVDVEREIMAVDAELHADEEALLLEDGSLQGNRSRGVDDPVIRDRIVRVVDYLVVP
jgi:hypothetical protein